ncbi:META domain-containing protein [Moraxella sp. VT-16-12]|uniref:META domain-containing protein n=1 Tax=Moraxella sp. VT-16-12 TaxID=2014877 RepID=UPI000B7EE2A2|nr:META domain-containing protein [Moraxella sp. VT-16-12]TWV83042.1 META domain-containing protein [Moraxella sp. VT-16-12]
MQKQLAVTAVLTMAGLLGCQATLPPMTTVPAMVVSSDTLQQYDWQLVSVTNQAGKPIKTELFHPANKPLVVSFDKDNVRFKNTCNHLWGSYQVVDTKVMIGDMASTMKLCEPALMAVDRLAPSTLKGQYDFVLAVGKLPTLVVSSDEQISRFIAIAK